jgi:tetratricopeptide (TPR) repeat protein
MKRFSCQLRLLFLLLGATFLASGQPVSLPKIVEPVMPSNRIPVALLGFENQTGDAAAEWGRVALEGLLADGLRGVKAVRILRGVDYAFRQMDIKDGAAIDPSQAQKLGEIIEARWVVWGSYKRARDKWRATARVLNVATGKSSTELTAAARDWHEVRDRLMDQILKEWGITPAPGEQSKMRERWTTSPEALEYVCQEENFSKQKFPETAQAAGLRKAIPVEPECGVAYGVLAAILGNRGEITEAEKAARRAVELKPGWSRAHLTLGTLRAIQGKYQEAETELQIAARLDPDEPEVFVRLGEMDGSQDLPAQAIESFEKALQLDPFSASAHAHLGRAFALQADREKAMRELKTAARLVSPEDINTEQILAEAYDKLSEAPSAIEHYEKLLVIAKRRGMEPDQLRSWQDSLKRWKASLSPVYFHVALPATYSEATFNAVLQQKLSREEAALVVNPLTRTPEMERWSKALTAGGANDFQKGKMLMDGLARQVDVGLRGTDKRTAAEVFADWNKPGASFLCMDYALLYVSLARAAGLRSYIALVQQECDDRKVLHACAGVVVADEILLADPAYRWFGAPHKIFALLDDVQVAAASLSCQGDLARCQIACKLAPDLVLSQENLFFLLAGANRWDEARRMRRTLLQLDTTGVMANFAEGSMNWHDGNLDEATSFLRKAVELDPDQGEARLLLGYIYWQRSQLRAALGCYREALNGHLQKENIQNAHDAVAALDEAIEADDKVANSHPATATGFFERAQARWRNGDMAAVLSDYDQAVRLNPKYFEAYRDRGVLYRERGQFDQAIFDFTAAARLNDQDYNIFEQRGAIYLVAGRFENALADFREAARLNAKDDYALNAEAWLCATCAEASVRDGRAAVVAAKKACELAGWKKHSYIDTLAAACAEAGDFEQAVKYEKQAIDMAQSEDRDQAALQRRLTLYENRLPYHEKPKSPEKPELRRGAGDIIVK